MRTGDKFNCGVAKLKIREVQILKLVENISGPSGNSDFQQPCLLLFFFSLFVVVVVVVPLLLSAKHELKMPSSVAILGRKTRNVQ